MGSFSSGEELTGGAADFACSDAAQAHAQERAWSHCHGHRFMGHQGIDVNVSLNELLYKCTKTH